MYQKVSQLKYKRLRHITAMPFILGMAFPIVFFDVCLELYHRVAFPLYGLPINKRGHYIRIDRQKLSYLSFVDKQWCTYCGYANGLFAYAVKIAGDTERYWCAIKHQPAKDYVEPTHHAEFLNYGDKVAYDNFVTQKDK